jgi:hypothetical protein
MEVENGEQPYGDGSPIPTPASFYSPVPPVSSVPFLNWTKVRAPIVALVLLLTTMAACAGITVTLGHYCRPHQGANHGVHHATHWKKSLIRRQARSKRNGGGGGATTGNGAANKGGGAAADGPGCPLDVKRCARRTKDGFCPLRQLCCPWVDYDRGSTACQVAALRRETQQRFDLLDTKLVAAGVSGTGTQPEKIARASNGVQGRLRWENDFEDVWVDGVHYDLRGRDKARLCLEYLVGARAYSVESARHFLGEIDPYVRKRGDFIELATVQMKDYFYSPSGKLAKLRRALIQSAGRNGKYYLRT